MLPFCLVIVSLACGLPFMGGPTPTLPDASATPTLQPTPTATPQPLPANLVETDPPQSAEVPLNGPITLYFNQPMDRASVEASLASQAQQQLTFNWVNESTVIVYLSSPLPPESQFKVGMSDSVRSAQGKPLYQTINLSYRTAGFVRVTQLLPANDSTDVDPTTAVLAAFNRPMVPLGADQASLPPGFSLEPQALGRGEWLNTSTYAFYPAPGLAGGKQYTARINPDLKSTDGGPLAEAQAWNFTTAMPAVTSIEPVTETPWRIDAKVKLTFNQPMDTASVEANFSLNGPAGPTPGTIEWEKDNTIFNFTPANLLARGADYTLILNGQAQALGGTPLGDTLQVGVITMSSLRVAGTDPAQGEVMDYFRNMDIYFSGPIQSKDVDQYIQVEPAIPNLNTYWDAERLALSLSGTLSPKTTYTVRISPELKDIWGGSLGQEAVVSFTTASLPPTLQLVAQSAALFLTPQDNSLTAQAANLDSIPLEQGTLSLNDFLALLGPSGYELQRTFRSPDQIAWSQTLNLVPDQIQTAPIYVRPDQAPLSPGLYYLRFAFPENTGQPPGPSTHVLAVSHLQVTLKLGTTDALVWAVDLRSGAPVGNAPVILYREDGSTLAQGQTDATGVWRATFEPVKDPYQTTYAVLGQPGADLFGITGSNWNAGLSPWDFGINSDPQPPGTFVYFYSDRPIYRPGHTVYFRAVVRQAFNGRYTPPQINTLPVAVFNEQGARLVDMELPISAWGTAHGEFTLPADAVPGSYSISSSADNRAYLEFKVADYRKPEINLQVSFDPQQARAGQQLNATVNARYFFDAPAGGVKAHWVLYTEPAYFALPGYQVGPQDTGWLQAFRYPQVGVFGTQVDEGDARTEADGTLKLSFPTELSDTRLRYTLEVTVQDESGLPVSGRDSAEVNPDDFYIGIRPDAWVGRAGEPVGFEIMAADWNKKPAGTRNLHADFQKVVYVRQDPAESEMFGMPTFTPEYTLVGSTDFATNQEGLARLAFTPSEPGTYMLDVYNAQADANKGTRTQVLTWVGGAGQVIWPDVPNSRLRLVTDKDAYRPGETAQVFIPNPFGAEAPALITLERGVVVSHQLLTVPANGYSFSLPLTGEHAPNVYLAVTLLGRTAQGVADFRQGLLNLPVEPVEQKLNVILASQPQRAGPGEPVTFAIQVSDSAGNPVQGEFSLAVVDLAALVLADPNSKDILEAFYAAQPLGVQTSHTLAAYDRRTVYQPGGLGGGGGDGAPSVVRERFPDTAYWNAEVTTGPDGMAQVSMNLPDTLTTWQVDTRGLTLDTKVGQAQTQIVTTKELLVRPVTPRFFVANDHAELAAIVQNNTDSNLQVEVSLQATGFSLDEGGKQTQQVSVAPQGRARVAWWGTVQNVDSVDLVFSAQGGGRQDAARPALGRLPVVRFAAQQTFRTSGTLDGAGEVSELVSLPRSFQADGGRLDVEMSSTLAGSMLRALDALESASFESTEQILSSFLPNLETYRTLQTSGIDDPALKSRLDRTLNQGLQRLIARQNGDGGWSWWQPLNPYEATSDPYITAYVLFGLSRARQAGISLSPDIFERAITFLHGAPPRPAVGMAHRRAAPPPLSRLDAGHDLRSPLLGGGGGWPPQDWEWDRLAFQQFALAQVDAAEPEIAALISQEQAKLSPWAKALHALTLEKLTPGNLETQALLSELESQAVRSSTGAFWELGQGEQAQLSAGYNMQTTLSNSALVLYALAQRNAASPLVDDAVRYLMANRGGDGAWFASYTTAWTLLALDQVIQSTGELNGDFSFQAALNNNIVAQGQAAGSQQLTPVNAQVPIQRMYPDYPNSLVIQRGGGPGRLYYAVGLNVSRPVEDAAPLSQGLSVERTYYPLSEDCLEELCSPVQSAKPGDRLAVRVTLTAFRDLHYAAVSDYIPAGAEIVDTSLKTSQQGMYGEPELQPLFDPRNPFARGFGWWLFSQPQIYDDHITWTADYLPAGSYELYYILTPLQSGQYRVLPARAWQLYFPEVQANSAGGVFEIKP
jgi:hypothetical protein